MLANASACVENKSFACTRTWSGWTQNVVGLESVPLTWRSHVMPLGSGASMPAAEKPCPAQVVSSVLCRLQLSQNGSGLSDRRISIQLTNGRRVFARLSLSCASSLSI